MKKFIAGLLIFIILIGFIVWLLLLSWPNFYQYPKPIYGLSLSQKRAEELSLDWKDSYLKILDELKVKKIRLTVYWDKIELIPDQFIFDDLDWQIQEAEKREVKIILAIGQKVPGWPECHFPDWVKILTKKEREGRVLIFLKEIIERYKNWPFIEAWQIENEPLLKHFGICPKPDKNFLDQEIKLVRDLAPDREIIISDSGELSDWLSLSKRADILGITIYRTVFSSYLKKYFHYFLPPAFYQLKAFLVQKITGVKKIIVVEFQAEPWSPKGSLVAIPPEEQFKSMNFEKFQKNLIYSQQTGFSEIYFWGAEWWLYLKEKSNDDRFWQKAKEIF